METIMLKEIKSEPELMKRCFETNKELIKEISQAINNFKPTNILIALADFHNTTTDYILGRTNKK